MKIWSDSFKDGAKIPAPLAFCKIDAGTHAAMSDNRNPHLAWSDLPENTRSLVVICHDYDVPSRVLVDLPANMTSIAEGEFSSGITARGKSGPDALHGARQGINDYTAWFAGDKDMEGYYYGYDGPCPPWNDAIPHHYVFTLYALDTDKLAVTGRFTGQDVMAAMQGHILGKASITGVYSLNPAVASTL